MTQTTLDKPTVSHTKGPWKVKLNYDNIMSEEVEGRHTVKGENGWNVARIWELPESEANARLIAEAPEYDALLELALKYLEHPDVQAMPFALPASAVAARIRAARAKAEGR